MPEFRSAGETMGGLESSVAVNSAPTIFFPRLHIDIDKFPELSKDIGTTMELLIRVKVVGKHIDSENKSDQDVEVREFYVPAVSPGEFKSKSVSSMNDADIRLANLKGS